MAAPFFHNRLQFSHTNFPLQKGENGTALKFIWLNCKAGIKSID